MNFPAALTATALYKYLISIPAAGLATVLLLQKAVNLINAQHADLVLFTGDLVNNVATELDEFIPILEQIKGKRRSVFRFRQP